jgi:preprotein translocase subunit SecE
MANDKQSNKPAKKEKKPGRGRQFFKEVMGELKKLSWPTKRELVSYTLTVIGFIALMAVIIYALDLAFSEGLGLLAKL